MYIYFTLHIYQVKISFDEKLDCEFRSILRIARYRNGCRGRERRKPVQTAAIVFLVDRESSICRDLFKIKKPPDLRPFLTPCRFCGSTYWAL